MSRIRAHHHAAEKSAKVRPPSRDSRRARIEHFDGVRAVACDLMGIRYKPVAAPRDADQLRLATSSIAGQSAEEYRERRRIPRSFEILTELKA